MWKTVLSYAKNITAFLLMIGLTLPIGYLLRMAVFMSDGITSFNLISCIFTGYVTAFIACVGARLLFPSISTKVYVSSGLVMLACMLLGIGLFWLRHSVDFLLASASTFGIVLGFFTYPMVSRRAV